MTSKVAEAGDLLRCPDSMAHVWSYLGKAAQAYWCTRCAARTGKRALKEATDA